MQKMFHGYFLGPSVNGKPLVSKTRTAGSIPAGPATSYFKNCVTAFSIFLVSISVNH